MPRRDTLSATLPLLAAFFLLVALAPRGARAQREPFSGIVLAAPAGDSLEVRDESVSGVGTALVRLHGVECPAAPRALKEVCARYTARLALGRSVTVTPRGRGADGALWGEVVAAGGTESLNVALVEAGLARWARAYAPERADLRGAEERAAAARRGLWGAPDGSNVPLPPPPSPAPPLPPSTATSPRSAPAVPAALPPPSPAPPATSRLSEASRAAGAGENGYRDLLAVFLVAFGVALGAFVVRDLGRHGVAAPAGNDVTPPGARWRARVLVACVVGVSATLLSALPRALISGADAAATPSDVVRAAAAGALTLLASVLLVPGAGRLCAVHRYRRARELDPARFGPASPPAWGRIHGVAKLDPGVEPARAETIPVSGLWLRETAGAYAVVTRRARGRHRGRWRQQVAVRAAERVRIESDAGDGSGAALLRLGAAGPAAADIEVLPYVVARYYNGMPVRRFFRAAYEGDTRTETQLLPEGARVTAWGLLIPPEEPGGLPEFVPDPLSGPRVLADDAVAAAVGGRHVTPAFASLGTAAVLTAAAVWLAGSGGHAAWATLQSSLGASLLVALVAGLRRAAHLTGDAPDAAATYRWRETGLSVRLLFAAVG